MKKLLKTLALAISLSLSLGFFGINAYAEENTPSATSIRLMPVSKILQIASDSVYDESFEVFNDGDSEIKVEIYAAPYSYVYSDSDDSYKLGFSNENNFTQISRWISFLDNTGNYVEKPIFAIAPHESIVVNFRIATPSNIPAGGQYAVVFVHSISSTVSSSGIRTEASPGIVIYGRSTEGEVTTTAEISDLKIGQGATANNPSGNNFYATAKIKNTGNVDFTATGKMVVEPVIGGRSYETAANTGRLSVIPEAELVLTDEWTETPSIGIYKVTWTVTAGDKEETISRTIFLVPLWLIISVIILLTILTIWIIITIRKRKDRRSRLAI